jgi:uncharacterized protein YbaP (TraB family)
MRKALAGLLGAWMILLGLNTPALGIVTSQDVQSLFDRYGKDKLIEAVLKLRNNRITVQVQDTFREFIGPPSTEFITVETLERDLNKTSVDAKELEALFSSSPPPLPHQPRAIASKPPSLNASESFKNTLWSVKTNKNTLYLLGSLHTLKADSNQFSREIEKAYEDSEKIVFETNIGAMYKPATLQKMMTLGLDLSGKTLSQQISDETYGLFKEKITALGLPVNQFERLKPWLCALTIVGIELRRLGFDPEYGIDNYFFNKAKREGKKCIFLETVDYQLELFANLDELEQESFLKQTLKDLEIIGTMAQEITNAWKNGDVGKLGNILQMSFEDQPEMYDRFLVQRNRAWLEKIVNLMNQEDDVLVIVGAAHLAGKESLIELLESKGHEIVQM